MPPRLLAVDLGSGALRSVVFDTTGAQLACAYEEIRYQPSCDGAPGAWEFDTDDVWNRIAAAVRRSLHESHTDPSDVLAVSTTSQRHGIAIIGRDGETLYAGPNRDSRGRTESFPDMDPARVYALNGRHAVPILAPYRLRWFQRHEPRVMEQAAHLLMLNDWVAYQFSGEAACADSSAAESLLMNIADRDWSPELSEAFDVQTTLLPPVVRGGDVIGKVTAAAADACGLKKGTPVVAGGGDTQCAMLGCGAIEPGQVGVVAGTTAPVQAVAATPSIDPKGRVWTGVHVPSNRWVHESNAGSAGFLLRWFRDEFGRQTPEGSPETYDAMLAPADSIAPGADGLMAILSPPAMDLSSPPARHRGFIFAPEQPRQMESTVTNAHMARAILEAIAYAVKGNYRQLVELAGGEPESVAACGGCTQSRLFVQTLADVLGKPVTLPQVAEATALGAAICAATGAGVYGSIMEAAHAMTASRIAAEPNPARSEIYEGLYQRWLSVAKGLATLTPPSSA